MALSANTAAKLAVLLLRPNDLLAAAEKIGADPEKLRAALKQAAESAEPLTDAQVLEMVEKAVRPPAPPITSPPSGDPEASTKAALKGTPGATVKTGTPTGAAVLARALKVAGL